MISSLTFNGLQLIGGTNFDILTGVEGLEAPEDRVTAYDNPGEDGGAVTASYYGLRGISLSGLVKGSSCEAHEDNRRALQAAAAIMRDSSGFPQSALLEFTTRAGQSYFVRVHPRSPKMPVTNGNSSPFFLSLVAPDHRIYLDGLQSTGSITIPLGGGATYPVTYPVTYGATSGGSALANNTGSVMTHPTLTLRGQLTNPYIRNLTTGQAIQVNRVIAGGETVVIDMGEKIITLNGSGSLLPFKGGEWWGLEPGSNQIALSTGSISDDGTVELNWYSAVLGI